MTRLIVIAVAILLSASSSLTQTRVTFTGRWQHDLAIVDHGDGTYKESNIRRVRFGPRITFFRDYVFHAELEVNPRECNPFYVRFTDLYVTWQKHPKAVPIGQ